jgi:hypothetical protein
MSSKDMDMHQNILSEKDAHVEMIEKSTTDTIATAIKQAEHIYEQGIPVALHEDELATISGAGLGTRIGERMNNEFGRTGIAGVAGLLTAVTSYEIVSESKKKKKA